MKSLKLLNDVEKTIEKYFPRKWRGREANFFVIDGKYELDVDTLHKNLNEPIRDFVLRGGKRLRPVLFLTVLELFKIGYKKYLDLAVMIELIHNGTLVLDDIEDDGELRRGQPTCHREFGLDTATNVGMSLHVMPLRLLLSNHHELSDKQKVRLLQIYADELINVSFGQALDIYWHKHIPVDLSVEQYLEMVRLKTGSLMRMSMRAACVVAGQSEGVEKKFSDFAETIGMAFQIIDDSLDLSSSRKLGKTYGNDITEGKMSLPVILALGASDKEGKKRLLEILRMHTRNRRRLQRAVRIIEETGGRTRAVKFAQDIVDKAWKDFVKDFDRKYDLDNLKELTYFLVKREY